MRSLFTLLGIFLIVSCIPLRIAPKIKGDKIKIAIKFKRKLPNKYAYIFKDPKVEDAFFRFMDEQYKLNGQDVDRDIPFEIESEIFFLSFYEVEIPTKTINLIPIIVNVILASKDIDPIMWDLQFTRIGHWYFVLTVTNSNLEDCLTPNYLLRSKIVDYLRTLKFTYYNSPVDTAVSMEN